MLYCPAMQHSGSSSLGFYSVPPSSICRLRCLCLRTAGKASAIGIAPLGTVERSGPRIALNPVKGISHPHLSVGGSAPAQISHRLPASSLGSSKSFA